MLKLCCILANPAFFCLNNSTDTKFFPFTEADKDLFEDVRENFVGGPFTVFYAKQLFMKLLERENQQIRTSHLWGLMQTNNIHIRRINLCPPIFIGIGISVQKQVESYLVTSRPVTLNFKNVFLTFFQRTRPDCEIENFNTPGRQKKYDSFSGDGFSNGLILIATLSLRLWVALITFGPVIKFDHFSQKRKFKVVAKWESSMNWDEAI